MPPLRRTRGPVWTRAERQDLEQHKEEQQTRIERLDERLEELEGRLTSSENNVMTTRADGNAARVQLARDGNKDEDEMHQLKVKVATLERELQRVLRSIQVPAASPVASLRTPHAPRSEDRSRTASRSRHSRIPSMPGGASLEAPLSASRPRQKTLGSSVGAVQAVSTTVLLNKQSEASRDEILEIRRDEYVEALEHTARGIHVPTTSLHPPVRSVSLPPLRDLRFAAHTFKRRDVKKGMRRDSLPWAMKLKLSPVRPSLRQRICRSVRRNAVRAGLTCAMGGYVALYLWKAAHYESRYA